MGVVSSLSVDSKKAPTKGCTYRNNSMWQDSGEHAHFIHTGVVTGIDTGKHVLTHKLQSTRKDQNSHVLHYSLRTTRVAKQSKLLNLT